MTFIQDKHEWVLASRLKALSELLMRDVKKYYDHKQVDFEPRWFALMLLVSEQGSMSVTEIARELLQSHPAVNQTVNLLEKKGLVESRKDGNDSRRRLISLTGRGKEKMKAMTPLWEDIHAVNMELLEASAPLLLDQLNGIEKALDARSLYDRILEKDKNRNSSLTLKGYSRDLGKYFLSLNKQWIEHYFKMEPADLKVLKDPEGVIARKGEIYFADHNGTIAGTFCLLPVEKGTMEISKLAVDKDQRGRGIGKFLLDSAIQKATRRKVRHLVLYTSPVLIEANNLYIKRGFYYVENDKKDFYKRPTVKMQLDVRIR